MRKAGPSTWRMCALSLLATASKMGFSIERNQSGEMGAMATGMHAKNGGNQGLSGGRL